MRPHVLLGLVLLIAGAAALQEDEVGMSVISPATVRAEQARGCRPQSTGRPREGPSRSWHACEWLTVALAPRGTPLASVRAPPPGAGAHAPAAAATHPWHSPTPCSPTT